jgi:hypothetical protein
MCRFAAEHTESAENALGVHCALSGLGGERCVFPALKMMSTLFTGERQ